jgi:flagellar hook-length control protein FliK
LPLQRQALSQNQTESVSFTRSKESSMRSSLTISNLKSPVAAEPSPKNTRKVSSPADSSDRSFQHVLTHARKSAKSDDTSGKTEKTKTSKATKTKTTKEPVVATEQRKKADKASSAEAEDADTQDATSGSPNDDNSSPEDDPTTPQAQNQSGKDIRPGDQSADPSDDAQISDAAHDADENAAEVPNAKGSQAASDNPATTRDSNGKTPATITNNPAASATVTQSQPASRQVKVKAANAADFGDGQTPVSSGKGPARPTTDSLTTPPGLPATVVQSAQKDSQGTSSSTTAVEPDSSADTDSPDTDSDATTATSPIASADSGDIAGDGRLADPASAAAIGQSSFATLVQSFSSAASTTTSPTPAASVNPAARGAASPASPGAKFVADNHPAIVQSVKTQLLPTGGTMRLRLDPPELGAMQVSVHLKDGVVTASFETSNDQATKMLSHSLGQLKQALESQGITVGKMHVQQSAKSQSGPNQSADSESDSDQSQENTSSSQQDEQRRETLRRMWERLSIGGDPLDMVA